MNRHKRTRLSLLFVVVLAIGASLYAASSRSTSSHEKPLRQSAFDRDLDAEIALLKKHIHKAAEPTSELRLTLQSTEGSASRIEPFLRLYAIWDFTDFARWDGRIPNILTEILASQKASPLLKSHSLWFLREADLRQGNLDAARQKQDQLGFVTDWLIIGPFDNEGMAGFDLVYPPEEETNLAETYNGKERPVSWRPAPTCRWGLESLRVQSKTDSSQLDSGSLSNPPSPERAPIPADCYIDLAAMLRPDSNTAAYALSFVFSPESQPVAVRLASDDCGKVWVANRLVLSDGDRHLIGFDQAVAAAFLEKGWNALLAKVCQEDGPWGFRLRLTAPDGSLLSSLRHIESADDFAAALQQNKPEKAEQPAADSAVNPIPVADPIAELKSLGAANPDNAQYHANLSFFLSRTKACDRSTRQDVRELETAVSLAPREWKYHLWLAELYDDENKKRASNEKVIDLNPDCAPAYSNLARHYAYKKLEDKSIQLYREALARDPSYYPAVLGLAEQLSASSQKAVAANLLREVLASYPDAPYPRTFAVGFTPFPTTPQRLERTCHDALRLNFCDNDVRKTLLSRYDRRHDLDGEICQLKLMEEISPLPTSTFLTHARILSDRGDYDEAMSLIDHALSICPEDDAALRQKGEVLLQQARRDEAIEWLQRSFAVKPQNRPLREYIEFLKPKQKPFEDDYKRDAASLVADAASETGSEGDSAVYLFDLWVREVHPNGLSNSYHQEVVKILSEAAVENFRFRRAIYRPTTDEVQVKAARVFKKDGRILNADGPFTYTFGGEEKLYYDLEARYVRCTNLEPGDVIEFSYRANAITPTNMYGDYYGDLVYLKDVVPKKLVEYVVIVPPGKNLYYKVVGTDLQPSIETRSDNSVYTWKAENVSKIESEPFMPGYSEVLPYVHVSTYKDWESVGEWYWNLIRDQFLLDSAARTELARVLTGLKTEQEKIIAIYNYVVQNTRYIGLEFGIHGHKPYPAYKVNLRRFGDCKDKAALMTALLKEIGVDACMAVVRTKSKGAIEPEPASLAIFDHVICHIPKYDLWLDGTAEYSGSREFPYEDQGTCALVVGKGIRRFVTTPVLPSDHNVISDAYQAEILPNGAIQFALTRESAGQYASYFRKSYLEEKDRENALARAWGTTLPNVRFSDIRFDDLRQLEKPVRYSFKALAPNYAVTDASGSMAFSCLIGKLNLTRRFAPLSKRKLDLVMDFPWSAQASVKFSLPPGYKVLSLPQDIHLQTDFGKCDVESSSPDASSVNVGLRFSLDVTRIRPDQYDAFREFCRLVDEKHDEKIRIAK